MATVESLILIAALVDRLPDLSGRHSPWCRAERGDSALHDQALARFVSLPALSPCAKHAPICSRSACCHRGDVLPKPILYL